MEQSERVMESASGESFRLESVTLAAGAAHQVWLSFCDGWLVAYQVLPRPGFSFAPVSIESLVQQYYENTVKLRRDAIELARKSKKQEG